MEAAVGEFRRQIVIDEPDCGFVPRDVLRRLHRHVLERPETTVAAVVAEAVTFCVRCVLNIEEIAPEVARMAFAGRVVEPVPSRKGGAA